MIALEKMLRIIEKFRSVHRTMPVSQAMAFLLVAMEPGLSVSEYAKRLEVSQSVMTRHLLDLGVKRRDGSPGFGLLTQQFDPQDMRRHQTFLTVKGEALLKQIIGETAGTDDENRRI